VRSASVTLNLHAIFKTPDIIHYCDGALTKGVANSEAEEARNAGYRAHLRRAIAEAVASAAKVDALPLDVEKMNLSSLGIPRDHDNVVTLQRQLEAILASPEAGSHGAHRVGHNFLDDMLGKDAPVSALIDELAHGYCVFMDYRMTDFLHDRMLNTTASGFQMYNTRGNKDLDVLYYLQEAAWESQAMHTKSYWLGVQSQQHPYDAMTIQDIIVTNKPDLIIETGTNNGGGSLFFASILELAEMASDNNGGAGGSNGSEVGGSRGKGARVVTIDVNDPAVGFAVGQTRSNPMDSPLWSKRVTFLRGMSTASEVRTNDRLEEGYSNEVIRLLVEAVSYDADVDCDPTESSQYVMLRTHRCTVSNVIFIARVLCVSV
jgi:cephalosporin hydroxylase